LVRDHERVLDEQHHQHRAPHQTTTNYSTNILGGTNVFTIPMNMNLPCQFFRIITTQSTLFTETFSIPSETSRVFTPQRVHRALVPAGAQPQFSGFTTAALAHLAKGTIGNPLRRAVRHFPAALADQATAKRFFRRLIAPLDAAGLVHQPDWFGQGIPSVHPGGFTRQKF